ncbi:methyltransferase domain-containing protein [Kribbella sp. NBC_01245]|uniref:methyltransferase domain-containing protein n=1 Tax=Kribbella sp. NBC_01245 TaxID=2903578 RepID=UPI002E290103|nr:methyltransferase domain-containing protein [Kribbella sp. NBC_01245]
MATERFLISSEQAEVYEERFVPALFRHWVDPVLQAAEVGPGDRLLDVACGTGVVARAAAERLAPDGKVTGVDLNPAMLAVARRTAPEIDWREGDVAALPFGDRAFDVVTCQAAIFFFPDPTGALGEMARVTRPGGRVVVQSFSSLRAQPAYGPWVDLVAQYAGPDAVELLGTYWAAGDPEVMRGRCAGAGLRVIAVHEHTRPAYFPNIQTMVLTEVNATPLRDRLDQADLDRILAGSREVLGQFVQNDRLVIPLVGYVLAATPVAGAH